MKGNTKGPLPLSSARMHEARREVLGWECGGDVGRKEKEEVEEVEVVDETERAEDFPGGDGLLLLLLLLLWWGRKVGHFFFSLLVSLVFCDEDSSFSGRGWRKERTSHLTGPA